jgi:hypothetical protein
MTPRPINPMSACCMIFVLAYFDAWARRDVFDPDKHLYSNGHRRQWLVAFAI